MESVELNKKILTVKQQLQEVAGKMLELQQSQKGIRPPEESFFHARETMNQNDFDLVVCGEAKQGKTSFINALLGKSLLPVMVEVATSQVFRISHAENESFHLVFEDGTRETITKEQMINYGTETGERLAGDPLLRGKVLRWIEVNTPARFLPPNVHLLDTPGLGALHYTHAEITNRYVATADAVIFIKNISTPLVDKERDFLRKVFTVTPNVMFVQTMVDLVEETARREQWQRAENQLNMEFKSLAGRELKLWPVSSTLLLKAGQEENPMFREIKKKASGFDAMLQGLDSLVYRTVGYSCSCFLCNAEFTYYKSVADFLREQQALLSASSPRARQELQTVKNRKRAEFEQEWGPQGSKMTKLNDEIGMIFRKSKNETNLIFDDMEIYRMMADEIDKLPSDVNAVNQYAAILPEKIMEVVDQRWAVIAKQTQANLYGCFDKLQEELELVTAQSLELNNLEKVTPNQLSGFERYRNVFLGATMGMTTASLLIAPFTGGLSIVVGAVIGAVLGHGNSKDNWMKNARSQLKSHVNVVLRQIRNKQYGTRIDEFFDSLSRNVQTAGGRLVERQSSRMQEECRILDEQSRLNEEKAKATLEEIKALSQKWDQLRRSLSDIREHLVELNQVLVF